MKKVLLYVRGGDASPAVPSVDQPGRVRFSDVVHIDGGTWDAENHQFIPGASLNNTQARILAVVQTATEMQPSPEAPEGATCQLWIGDEAGAFGDVGPSSVFPAPQIVTLFEGAPVYVTATGKNFGPETCLLIIEA